MTRLTHLQRMLIIILNPKLEKILILPSRNFHFLHPGQFHRLKFPPEVIKTVASSAGTNDLLIIMGDFNIPSARWNSENGYYVQSMISIIFF